MKRQFIWWTAFAVATFALSKVFEASRLMTSGHWQNSWLSLVLWGVLMVMAILVLGYDAYWRSKSEGKVVHQVKLFEKFHQIQNGENRR